MLGRLFFIVSCLSLSFPSLAAVTGVVMDTDGQPIAGARITAYALETGELRRARYRSEAPVREALAQSESAKNGAFSLQPPKDHPVVVVQIEAPGYAPAARRVELDDEIGAVALSDAAMKTGRVTSGGAGVAGARVIWTSGAELVVTSDGEGKFAVPDPAKWATAVVVVHPAYAIAGERRALQPLTIDRQLDSGVKLSGRVVGTDGKTPVAGAQIFVDGWPSGESLEDGSFAIAHAPKSWEWLGARSGKLSGRRARGGTLDVRLEPAGSVTGTLRDVKTAAPIAGAEIMLTQMMRPPAGAGSESAITDARGNFTITDAAPGRYALFGTHPRYDITRVDVSIGPGVQSSRGLVGLRQGRLAGTVVDEQDRPVAGARISQRFSRSAPGAVFTGSPEVTVTGPDGAFITDAAPDVDVTIHARKKMFPDAKSATVRVEPGERKSGIVITMPSGVSVTGRVTDRDGNPLSGVAVRAVETSHSVGSPVNFVFFRNTMADDESVTTAENGSFSITLAEGKHDIGFRRDGFALKVLRAQEVGAAMRPLAVTLDPGVSITGRVTRDGAGVPGAAVNFIGDSREYAATADDGSFLLSDLSPGRGMLIVSKSDEFIHQSVPVTAPAKDVAIDIPPGGRITGRVVDKETKAAVTTFEAGISPARGGTMIFVSPARQKSFTTDDGTFVLDNVPAGPQMLTVNAAGYTTAAIPTINVEQGKSTEEITVEMDRGTRVSGRVTGPNGAPLGGVAVRLAPSSGRMVRAPSPGFASSAVTDADGEYVIESVEAGERTLAFALSGYVSTDKTAEVKGRETRVDAQLSTGIRVTGLVVTEGGAPIADVAVAASSASGSRNWSGTRSDQNGAFQLEALAPGRYSFRASKQGHASAELNDVDISSGAPIRLVLGTGGTIYGRVSGLEPNELANVVVSAYGPNGGASAAADSSGNFRIEGAPVGTVRVSARVNQPFGMGRQSAHQSVQVEAGSVVHADIDFRNDTAIRGRVTRHNKPVPHARMTFHPRPGAARTSGQATTDSSGYYEVLGLDDGEYNVSVADMQDGASFRTSYQVRGSGTFDIDMRTTAIRGRVVDAETGQPIPGAAVTLRSREAGSRTWLTDPSGLFIADGISAGAYDVSAEKEGYGTRVTEVTAGESPQEVELKLAPDAAVTIRVFDGRDGRTLSAFIQVRDDQDRIVYQPPPQFGFSGTREVTKIGLEPGSYRAVVGARGYASRTVSIQAPGSHEIALTPGGSIIIRSKGTEPRRGRLVDAGGQQYSHNSYSRGFTIDPNPGVTQLENIAPGVYTLQILGPRDEVTGSAQVVVGEGQTAVIEI